jgi:hypothetical protein
MRGIRASEAKTHPTTDFLGSKVFVDGPGEPSLICDNNDRPCDFARIFGLALVTAQARAERSASPVFRATPSCRRLRERACFCGGAAREARLMQREFFAVFDNLDAT